MKKILSGFNKFQTEVFVKKKFLFSKLANNQTPEILFITCSDSRIDPNLITQAEPGDLFVVRNAGNIIPPPSTTPEGISASIEFAVNALGVKHIIVCGHSDCGAMKGVIDTSILKKLQNVKKWLSYSRDLINDPKSINDIESAAKLNVLLQIHHSFF